MKSTNNYQNPVRQTNPLLSSVSINTYICVLSIYPAMVAL